MKNTSRLFNFPPHQIIEPLFAAFANNEKWNANQSSPFATFRISFPAKQKATVSWSTYVDSRITRRWNYDAEFHNRTKLKNAWLRFSSAVTFLLLTNFHVFSPKEKWRYRLSNPEIPRVPMESIDRLPSPRWMMTSKEIPLIFFYHDERFRWLIASLTDLNILNRPYLHCWNGYFFC